MMGNIKEFGPRMALVFCVFGLLLAGQGVVMAQNAGSPGYLLKAGDTIHLSVPGHPDRDLNVTLDSSGQVSLPQIGGAQVGGLTVEQAERILRQRLRLVDPSLDSVSLSLVTGPGGGLGIHVLGEVAHSGEFSFMAEPSLFDLIRAAGGPTARANMLGARVVRVVDGETTVYPLDLSGLMAGENIPDFDLLAGDTMIIPALVEGVASMPGVTGVKVFGGVGVPMVVPMDEAKPLLDVLMMAGTPTADADLEKIFLVHQVGNTYKSSQINLKLFLEEGVTAGNPMVYPGDTLQVSYDRPGWIRRNVPFFLGSLAAIVTIWVGYDRIME
jgi:protein involved in polysaccharide export with SLBB domain